MTSLAILKLLFNRLFVKRRVLIVSILGLLFTVSNGSVLNAGSLNKGKPMKQHSVKLSDELTLVIKKTIQKQHKSAINQFEFIKVEEKNWPSSALGCPKSGMQYMQMMTPGYLVRVKADGIAHSVHTSLKHAVLCGQSKPDGLTHRTSNKPKVEASTLNRIKAIQLSRASLIQAKDIVANKVRLKSVNDALFNNLKTECKGNYAGKNSGFRVVLSHENLEAIFFSDGEEVIKCSSQTKL